MTRIRRNRAIAKFVGVGRGDALPYVLVHRSLISTFDDLVLSTTGSYEIGGIVIGRYRGPHLELIDLTKPGPADVSGPCSFLKQDPTHESKAQAAWKASGGTSTYVGEWHSHPRGGPDPSNVDRQNWRKVAKGLVRSAVFVIVAPAGWALYMVESKPPFTLTKYSLLEEGRVGNVYLSRVKLRFEL